MSKMLCRLKDCGKCGGDLVLDIDEWRCFQCGIIYYPQQPSMELLPDPIEIKRPLATEFSPGETGPDRKVRRSPRRINAVLDAKRRSDEDWWNRNQQVIHRLDNGNSIRQIAESVGSGARQIRMIRERLYDLRATAPELVAAG